MIILTAMLNKGERPSCGGNDLWREEVWGFLPQNLAHWRGDAQNNSEVMMKSYLNMSCVYWENTLLMWWVTVQIWYTTPRHLKCTIIYSFSFIEGCEKPSRWACQHLVREAGRKPTLRIAPWRRCGPKCAGGITKGGIKYLAPPDFNNVQPVVQSLAGLKAGPKNWGFGWVESIPQEHEKHQFQKSVGTILALKD